MNAPKSFQALDVHYRARVQESFSRQKAMALIQQKGYVHGGILGMIADTACGYAAFSLMPARGSLLARGHVIRPGRTLTIARAEVYADDGKHVATMQQTLMRLADTPDTPR